MTHDLSSLKAYCGNTWTKPDLIPENVGKFQQRRIKWKNPKLIFQKTENNNPVFECRKLTPSEKFKAMFGKGPAALRTIVKEFKKIETQLNEEQVKAINELIQSHNKKFFSIKIKEPLRYTQPTKEEVKHTQNFTILPVTENTYTPSTTIQPSNEPSPQENEPNIDQSNKEETQTQNETISDTESPTESTTASNEGISSLSGILEIPLSEENITQEEIQEPLSTPEDIDSIDQLQNKLLEKILDPPPTTQPTENMALDIAHADIKANATQTNEEDIQTQNNMKSNTESTQTSTPVITEEASTERYELSQEDIDKMSPPPQPTSIDTAKPKLEDKQPTFSGMTQDEWIQAFKKIDITLDTSQFQQLIEISKKNGALENELRFDWDDVRKVIGDESTLKIQKQTGEQEETQETLPQPTQEAITTSLQKTDNQISTSELSDNDQLLQEKQKLSDTLSSLKNSVKNCTTLPQEFLNTLLDKVKYAQQLIEQKYTQSEKEVRAHILKLSQLIETCLKNDMSAVIEYRTDLCRCISPEKKSIFNDLQEEYEKILTEAAKEPEITLDFEDIQKNQTSLIKKLLSSMSLQELTTYKSTIPKNLTQLKLSSIVDECIKEATQKMESAFTQNKKEFEQLQSQNPRNNSPLSVMLTMLEEAFSSQASVSDNENNTKLLQAYTLLIRHSNIARPLYMLFQGNSPVRKVFPQHIEDCVIAYSQNQQLRAICDLALEHQELKKILLEKVDESSEAQLLIEQIENQQFQSIQTIENAKDALTNTITIFKQMNTPVEREVIEEIEDEEISLEEQITNMFLEERKIPLEEQDIRYNLLKELGASYETPSNSEQLLPIAQAYILLKKHPDALTLASCVYASFNQTISGVPEELLRFFTIEKSSLQDRILFFANNEMFIQFKQQIDKYQHLLSEIQQKYKLQNPQQFIKDTNTHTMSLFKNIDASHIDDALNTMKEMVLKLELFLSEGV